MGMLFSVTASWHVRSAEHDRLMARVDELVSTVQSTVSVACFLNDATLEKEILQETNDVNLIRLIASLITSANDVREAGKKFAVVDSARYNKNRSAFDGSHDLRPLNDLV